MDNFEAETAESWEDFLRWMESLDGTWCFRGQRDSSWLLTTSLDRALAQPHLPGRNVEIDDLVFRFQQAHQYIPSPPEKTDLSSWLAIMQHHGAPTRLLDWTRSPYAALYFALEEEPPEDGCALWAIDLDWLDRELRDILGNKASALDGNFRAAFVNDWLTKWTNSALILRVDPLRLDDRMVAQQGLFLCSVTIAATFHAALSRMVENSDQRTVRKLVPKRGLRVDFLKRLRTMNIHRASLFPGLDGFGRSLWHELEISAKA